MDTQLEEEDKHLINLRVFYSKGTRIESIGHKAAAAAHSLGTPLSTISVIAKELRKEKFTDEKVYEDIDTLIDQSKNAEKF